MAHIRFSFYSPPPPHKNLKKSSARVTRRASTLLALSVLSVLIALLSISATASAQTPAVDYDTNDDGYISVANLAQLNAIRYDLNGDGAQGTVSASDWEKYTTAFPNAATGMGCPATGCVGYELTASLDFDTNGDGSVTTSGDTYWDNGTGWNPIGNSNFNRYSGDFKGNGYTINNLFINDSSSNFTGLFGVVNSNSRIETLGVTNANVTGNQFSGILFGVGYGEIVACYTTGKVQGSNYVGGLGGIAEAASSKGIFSSYSTAYVNGASRVGGLLGRLASGSTTHSYATGRVNRSSGSATTIGGLIGSVGTISITITANYWDTSTSGQTASAGGSGVTGKTTRQIQTPTGYTGIYANWNTNLDGDTSTGEPTTGNDNPWTFGNKMQYPMLDYDDMSTTPQNSQAMGIADNWNAPIVGERVAVCVTSATRSSRSGGWQWEKSTNGDTWTALSRNSGATYEYYPVASDVGSYLRAKAPLSGGGSPTPAH